MEPTENSTESAKHDELDACPQGGRRAERRRWIRSQPDAMSHIDLRGTYAGKPWVGQCKSVIDSDTASSLTQAASGRTIVIVHRELKSDVRLPFHTRLDTRWYEEAPTA